MEVENSSINTNQPLPQTNQVPSQPTIEPKTNMLVKVFLYVLGAIIFMVIGAAGFKVYESKTDQLDTKKVRPIPTSVESTPVSLPSVEPKPSTSAELKTYKDSFYSYIVKYPSDWQVIPFTNKDDYYNVTRSGVTFNKSGYEVTINNYGKIPKSGCGSLITSKNNFVKISVSPVELWRAKIEESIQDGMVAVNPQGAEFTTLNFGTYESIQTTAPNTDGSIDCNFQVNGFRYEILYKFPIIGEENLTNIDRKILSEMDKMVASIVWAK